MYYIIDGKTFNLENQSMDMLFEAIRDKFKFAYDFLYLQKKELIIADIDLCEKILDNKDVKETLLVSTDYDLKMYMYSLLNALITPTDINDLILGLETDTYNDGSITTNGGDFSCEELSYENDAVIVSLSNVDADNLLKKIKKNNEIIEKNFYIISSETQYYLINSIVNENLLKDFFNSFDNVSFLEKSRVEDWSSITKKERLKILFTFYKESQYIISNQFQLLGKPPGIRGKRVEKIDNVLDSCYEYRILNPNYRVYFIKKSGTIIILLGRLKKENKMTTHVKMQIKTIGG